MKGEAEQGPGAAEWGAQPLAYRMAPKSIEEFVGQEEILGKGKLLYRMIKTDRISSVILFGPPGTGKTSLARVIANTTRARFERINAVMAGVADIKRVIAETASPMLNPSGRTVLFIDEIHRFNKAQQDALLPSVESGAVTLIGATTENPFFEVNKALISRSSVFMLKPLTDADILALLRRAVVSPDGLGAFGVAVGEGALEYIASASGGDARRALNALELAFLTAEPGEAVPRAADAGDEAGEAAPRAVDAGDEAVPVPRTVPVPGAGTGASRDATVAVHIGIDEAKNCLQRGTAVFDKSGESHYDNISAFIKSMRGGDPDAAVFYLANAIAGGEDPMFLARRIVICAAEDVGLANPNALLIASAAAQAVHLVGLPEAQIILSEAAIFIATSPKSNSACEAIFAALEDVGKGIPAVPPMHLRNAPASGMRDLGYAEGYKYAHDYPGNWVEQQYLPDAFRDARYYKPGDNPFEGKLAERMRRRGEG